MHLPLGVFIPDQIVERGGASVICSVDQLMRPFHYEFERPLHRRYFTPEEIALIASEHGVDVEDLTELARAVASSESMTKYSDVVAGDEVIAWYVSSVGATESRLYCITNENSEGRYDRYRIGGRFDGLLGGAGSAREIDLSEEPSLEDNMAPVQAVIAVARQADDPPFDSFLTPDGKWYDYYHPERPQLRATFSWNLWHLSRFRQGHHVVMVDYHS